MTGVKKIAGLTSNQIKLIAVIAMTIDHITWAVFPGTDTTWYVFCLHIIGRLTAPIMWFFIAEGYHYTRDVKKYIARLFVFAIISHFAYVFAFGIPMVPLSSGVFNQTSVMWSLAWAVVLMVMCNNEHSDGRACTSRHCANENMEPQATCNNEKIPNVIKWAAIVGICLISFPSDWSSIAVMAPFFIYMHRGSFKKQGIDIVIWSAVYAAVYFIFLNKPYGILQMFTFLSIPVLSKYNGSRGSWKGMKWLFYIYYPAHLVVVGIIRLALHGDISVIF